MTVTSGTLVAVRPGDPCGPGSALSVAGILSGFVFEGTAALDGHTFTDLSGVPQESASLFMKFFGETVLPPFRNADLVVTLPFRMEGNFSSPSSVALLRGRGVASVLLQPDIALDAPPFGSENASSTTSTTRRRCPSPRRCFSSATVCWRWRAARRDGARDSFQSATCRERPPSRS